MGDDWVLLSQNKLGGSATAGIRAEQKGSVGYYHNSGCFDSIFKITKPAELIGGGIASCLL